MNKYNFQPVCCYGSGIVKVVCLLRFWGGVGESNMHLGYNLSINRMRRGGGCTGVHIVGGEDNLYIIVCTMDIISNFQSTGSDHSAQVWNL